MWFWISDSLQLNCWQIRVACIKNSIWEWDTRSSSCPGACEPSEASDIDLSEQRALYTLDSIEHALILDLDYSEFKFNSRFNRNTRYPLPTEPHEKHWVFRCHSIQQTYRYEDYSAGRGLFQLRIAKTGHHTLAWWLQSLNSSYLHLRA